LQFFIFICQEEEINDEGESANDIVYDDKAVDQLLDRSQEGIEEKESWANEYLSSFKVRRTAKKNAFQRKGQEGWSLLWI